MENASTSSSSASASIRADRKIPLAAVEVAVGLAREPRLVLVGAPADERQVHVAVDEAGDDRALVDAPERHRLLGQVVRRADEHDRALVVPGDAARRVHLHAAVAATPRAGSDPVAVASVAATAAPRPIAPAYPR